MTEVTILEIYDPISGATQFTASCVTPFDHEVHPSQVRLSGGLLPTQERAIESLRLSYTAYMARDKARVTRSTVEVEF